MRYRWTILGIGTAAQAAFSTVASGLPALAPFLKSHYRLSLGEIGVVLAAVGIGSLATLLPWGLAADRLGERVVIAVGLGAAGVVLVATGWTDGYGSLAGALVLAGMLGSSANAASGRAVMGWFAPEERGLALGIRQTSVPIGGAAAAAALPWIAHAGGTRLAFAVLGTCCAAAAVVAAVWLRDLPADSQAFASTSPLRDRTIWLLSLGAALYVTAQLAVLTFVVLFLHEERGMSAGAAAAVLAVIQVLGAGTRIAVGRWSDRRGERILPLRMLGAALAVAMLVAAAVVDAPLWLLLPAFGAAGVAGLAWNGLSFTATAETAGRARSGAALGVQQTALAVSTAVVPIAFAGGREGGLVGARVRSRGGRADRGVDRSPARAGDQACVSSVRRAITRNVGDPAGSSLNSGLTHPSSPPRCS